MLVVIIHWQIHKWLDMSKEANMFHTWVSTKIGDPGIYIGMKERLNKGDEYNDSIVLSSVTKGLIGEANTNQYILIKSSNEIKPVDIVEGFSKLFLDSLNMLPKKQREDSEKRYRQCLSCTIRSGNTCSTERQGVNINTGSVNNGCGCNLAAKTKTKDFKCPLGKW